MTFYLIKEEKEEIEVKEMIGTADQEKAVLNLTMCASIVGILVIGNSNLTSFV